MDDWYSEQPDEREWRNEYQEALAEWEADKPDPEEYAAEYFEDLEEWEEDQPDDLEHWGVEDYSDYDGAEL